MEAQNQPQREGNNARGQERASAPWPESRRATDENGNGNGKRRRRIALTIVGVLVLCGIGGGVWYYLEWRNWESTDDAFIDAHVIPISPRVSGHILHLAVSDNEAVTQGQLLVQLDPRDYQAQLTAAQAAVTAAQGRATQAEAGVRTAEANVAQAQADVAAADAEYQRRHIDYERVKQLLQSSSASQQEFTLAEAADRAAAAQLDAARKRVAATEAQVNEAKAKQGAAEADVQQAKASEEIGRLKLSYTTISAPEAGHVTRKSAEVGAFVQEGQNLMALVEPHVWVTANFKETQLTHMRPGQPATLKVDAYPGVTFHGTVNSIQAGTGARFSLIPPENATGNYVKVVQRVPVKITFDDDAQRNYFLAPGMSVVPDVRIAAVPGAAGSEPKPPARATATTAP